ncbi:MAG: hypothetical protein NVS2B7_11810 [Herpetosiphon sp.]
MASFDSARDLQPIDSWKVNFDHNDVRVSVIDQLDRLLAIPSLAADSKIWIAGQMEAQALSNEGLGMDKYHT